MPCVWSAPGCPDPETLAVCPLPRDTPSPQCQPPQAHRSPQEGSKAAPGGPCAPSGVPPALACAGLTRSAPTADLGRGCRSLPWEQDPGKEKRPFWGYVSIRQAGGQAGGRDLRNGRYELLPAQHWQPPLT